MVDRYIDYFEVTEYGTHLSRSLDKLNGASPLVNVEALKAEVDAAVAAVEAEMQKAGIVRGGARDASQTIEEKVARGRRLVEQFYNFLGAQDEDTPMDLVAFFPGGRLGSMARIKPDDLAAKMGTIVHGFARPQNANLPEAASWKARIEEARAGLTQAAGDRGGARGESVIATAGLIAAREAFLTLYNGVAKRLVLGVLNRLGRAGEYRLFFKDLQVNESRRPSVGPGEAVDPAPAPSPAEPVDA